MIRLLAAILVSIMGLTACATTPNDQPTEMIDQVEQDDEPVPPQLIAPADGAVFDDPISVIFQWDWRQLEDGEIFDVRVWREGEPNYGIAWTSASGFDFTERLRDEGPGEYLWSVAVITGNEEREMTGTVVEQAEPFRFTVEAPPQGDQVRIVDGFEIEVYADFDEIALPTTIQFDPEGNLHVLNFIGDVYVLLDTNGDNTADRIEPVYIGDDRDADYATGLDFYDGEIYLASAGKISILTDRSGDGGFDSLTPIVEDLPALVYPFHANNSITFGPDGKLYTGVGSTTDRGPLSHPLEASILRMNPDGSELEVFATGLRNAYDLVFSPDGELFTTDNGPDNFPDQVLFLPPDEFIHVREGKDYGFPEAFGIVPGHDSEPPLFEFLPSSVPSGMTYYDGDQFPPEYQDGIFVAMYGGGAQGTLERGIYNGLQVVFVRLERDDNGDFSAEWEVFAQFQGTDERPVDVVTGPDGALYIAEWSKGRIYRVVYQGED